MKFSPNSAFAAISCPADTFTFTLDSTTCDVCPAGKDCAGTTYTATTATTPDACDAASFEQADKGDPGCQTAYSRFDIAGSTVNAINMATCDWNEYKQPCEICPADKACDVNAGTDSACAAGTYSEEGWIHCATIPVGYVKNTGIAA